jgi:hypothetical protein
LEVFLSNSNNPVACAETARNHLNVHLKHDDELLLEILRGELELGTSGNQGVIRSLELFLMADPVEKARTEPLQCAPRLPTTTETRSKSQ